MRRFVLPSLILTALLVLSCVCFAAADEVRAFWVDAWGNGFLSQGQVDQLLGVVGDPNSKGDIRNANCNTVIMQVRRNADANYPSSMGEPYMSGLSPSNFNALQAVIDAAHDTTGGKQRIDVHCWMVTFRTSGGAVYGAHSSTPTGSLTTLDNYWPSRDDSGAEVSDKAFDPGHPLCEQYLTDVAMDLVNNFDIDGIHYDYIRFTANNQGYNPTSLARYNAKYGLTGQPTATDPQWQQWRRDQVTALVRRVYAKIQASKPWVKQSGSFVTWNPSPTASTRAAFQATRPYYDVYSDWDAWMQEGIVDMAVPMTYYNWASLPSDYTRWINFEKDRKANRHMVIGPGIYLNSLQNAIDEILMTRTASPAGNYAQGFSGYSYRVPYLSGDWASFMTQLVAQVTPTPANIPAMPWKSAPTKGHISGTVTYTNTKWVDGATVSITGPENRSMPTDGTGFYAFIDLTPGSYVVTASKTGYPNAQTTANVAIGAVTGNMYVRDLVLGGSPAPVITNVASSGIGTTTATITWTTDQTATSKVDYGLTTSYGSSTALDSNLVTSHSMGLSGLSQSTLYHYRVTSGNGNGTSYSSDYTFTTNGPPIISNVHVINIGATSATVTWTTSTAADGHLNYGLTSGYGSSAADPNTNTTSHSVSISGLTPVTTYHYQCVSTNVYGPGQTPTDLTFATTAVVTEIIIDNLDSGWSNTSPSGSWTTGSNSAVPKIGTDYLYTAGSGSSTATRKCRWTPNISVAGTYDVYAFYQKGTNRNTAAPYTTYYNGGQVTSTQNQYSSIANQGDWFLVAQDKPFLAGSAGYLELTNASTDTNLVSADAAKFVLKQAADTTPPVMSSITDDQYTTSTTSLAGTWSGADPESGIQRYEYAVGSTSGGVDKKGWTSAGTATSGAITGLSLSIGNTYYLSVRAVNGQNLTSSAMTSSGVTVARQVDKISDAKTYGDNYPVYLTARTVTANFSDRLYIEEDDRFSAMCVDYASGVTPGQEVQVYGRLGQEGGYERALKSCKVIEGSTGTTIAPLYMVSRAIGGSSFNGLTPGIVGGIGLYNLGMLVTIAGTVSEAQTGYMYVDDGGALEDGSGYKGIRVDTTGLLDPPAKDKHVVVTGICTVYDTGSGYVRLIRPRDNNDVVTYN